MDDFIIAKVSWLTKVKGNEDKGDYIKKIFSELIRFLKNNNLLVNNNIKENIITDDLEIKKSDLTEQGFEVLKISFDKWMQALDKGTKPEKITILEKALIKVREKNIDNNGKKK